MKFILIFTFIIVSFILIYNILTKKYINPYSFILVFGKKGSGKSCSMQKDLIHHYRKGWNCYADSNTDLPFVTKIDANNIYNVNFNKNKKSLMCIDEVNLLWDNRDFKQFDKRVQKFFREQRKHKVKIIAYSQTFDCDKKLRDLCDRLAIQKKIFRVFTFRRYYQKTPRIISAKESHDTSKIVDDYIKIPLFSHGVSFTFIPKYIKKYDTYEIHR